MACANSCAPTLASFGNCTPQIRKNTGKRLIGYACNQSFDVASAAAWGVAIAADTAFYSPLGTIAKPKGSSTTVQATPNRRLLTNVESMVTFETFDSNAAGADFQFFNALQSSATLWNLAYLDSEDNVYFLPAGADIFAAQEVEQSSPTATRRWIVEIKYDSIDEVEPTPVPGLNALIDAL